MRRLLSAPIVALVLSCVLLTTAACKPDGTSNGGSPFDWPDLVECGPGLSDLLGVVTRILIDTAGGKHISDAGHDELQALAEEHGANTVVCAIDKLAGDKGDWLKPGATQTPERMQAVERGRHFFRSQGIEVRRTGDPEASLYRPAPLIAYVESMSWEFDSVLETQRLVPKVVRWRHEYPACADGYQSPRVTFGGGVPGILYGATL